MIYWIHSSECRRSLWRVIDAIHNCSELAISDNCFDDAEKLKDMEAKFARAHERRYGNPNSWRGQVGAIDGVDIWVRSPGGPRAKRYFVERKNHFCILCTGICDSDRRFTFYDMSFEPQTHDSLAWVGTPLGQRFEETLSLHDKGYFFNGDNAYLGGKCMIVPGGSDAFDFYQSSNRMAIECAFGMLVRRFGVFWRPLEVAHHRRAPLVGACMKLHNFCIDEKIGLRLLSRGKESEINPRLWAPTPAFNANGGPVDFLDTFDHATPQGSGGGGRRAQLVAGLRDAGLVRPGTSSLARARNAGQARPN